MIVCQFEKGDAGNVIILVGLSKENINRMLQGHPVFIGGQHAASEALPKGYELGIMCGDTEQSIYDMLRKEGLIHPDTKITKDPKL